MAKATDPYVPWGLKGIGRKRVIYQWYGDAYRARRFKQPEFAGVGEQQELFDKWREGLRDWKNLSDHARMQWFNYNQYGGYW